MNEIQQKLHLRIKTRGKVEMNLYQLIQIEIFDKHLFSRIVQFDTRNHKQKAFQKFGKYIYSIYRNMNCNQEFS